MSDLRDRYQPATPVHAASADQDQVAGRAAARSPFGVDMRALVGRRLLDVRALPPCLRILVLTGVGAVVFVAALLAFRDALGPGVALAQGQRIAAPIAVAVFGLALLGWSCALTGALHSTWAVALLALVVFTLVNAAYFLLVDWDALPLAARLITAAPLLPLALLWLWGLFVQLLRAGAPGAVLRPDGGWGRADRPRPRDHRQPGGGRRPGRRPRPLRARRQRGPGRLRLNADAVPCLRRGPCLPHGRPVARLTSRCVVHIFPRG